MWGHAPAGRGQEPQQPAAAPHTPRLPARRAGAAPPSPTPCLAVLTASPSPSRTCQSWPEASRWTFLRTGPCTGASPALLDARQPAPQAAISSASARPWSFLRLWGQARTPEGGGVGEGGRGARAGGGAWCSRSCRRAPCLAGWGGCGVGVGAGGHGAKSPAAPEGRRLAGHQGGRCLPARVLARGRELPVALPQPRRHGVDAEPLPRQQALPHA